MRRRKKAESGTLGSLQHDFQEKKTFILIFLSKDLNNSIYLHNWGEIKVHIKGKLHRKCSADHKKAHYRTYIATQEREWAHWDENWHPGTRIGTLGRELVH